ncbi:MAG: TolC family protein [Candidatus Aureabacteria bacterium]|nr:TolC family protein [Candidatus Auribacterota bacterium]
MSLKEFIELSTARDTAFQEILIDELKLKYRKTLGLPAEDVVLSAKSQYYFFIDEGGGEPANTVSLSRLFPLSGTELEAQYSSTVRSSEADVSSELTFLVSQPIAENAFGKGTRLQDSIIGIEIDVARHQIVEAYEDYLAALIQTYYSWYSAYENLKTGENSYNENLKLLENIKERERNKIALPIDVNKITLQVLSKKENLYNLQNEYSRYLHLVKNAIRRTDDVELVPDESMMYSDVSIVFLSNYDAFKKESRTSRILDLLEEKGGLEVEKSIDELLPSIDLMGGFSIEGSGHSLDDSEKSVFIGISLDLPLQRSQEKARHETSKIELEKTKLSSETVHAQLYAILINLHDAIEREKKLIAMAEEKIAVAQAIVEDEAKNYSLGKVTLNDFIDVVNKLEDNKFIRIYHEIQLKKLTVEWLRLTDRLVTEKQVLKE